MPIAINNSRDDHIDRIKQTFFQFIEAHRRRQDDEAYLIAESLYQLGCKVQFREPQLLDPDVYRPRGTRP